MADLKAFAEQLVNLTVKEVSELADILERRVWYRTSCSCSSGGRRPCRRWRSWW